MKKYILTLLILLNCAQLHAWHVAENEDGWELIIDENPEAGSDDAIMWGHIHAFVNLFAGSPYVSQAELLKDLKSCTLIIAPYAQRDQDLNMLYGEDQDKWPAHILIKQMSRERVDLPEGFWEKLEPLTFLKDIDLNDCDTRKLPGFVQRTPYLSANNCFGPWTSYEENCAIYGIRP